MEEKKIVYQIVIDLWNLAKEFNFQRLSDKEWELLVEKGMKLREKFMSYGKDIDLLFRGMFNAVQEYYERKSKQ